MLYAPVKDQKKRYPGLLIASALAVIFIFASCGDDEATATPVAVVEPTATPIVEIKPTPTPARNSGPTPTPVVEEVEGNVYRNPKYPYSVVQPDGWRP